MLEHPVFMRPEALSDIIWGNAQCGTEATNLAEFSAAGVVWETQGNADVWASGQFNGASKPIDVVALLLTNATSTTTVRLMLGNSWDEALAGVVHDSGDILVRTVAPVVEREDGLSHWFYELPAGVSATHWRIEVQNHTGNFEASSLLLGSKVVPSRCYDVGYQFGADDLGSYDISQWGALGDTGGVMLRTLDFALSWNSEAEFEASFRPMMETNVRPRLIYCCFDKRDNGYRDARTYFGILGKPLVARGSRKEGAFIQEFGFRSLV